ncbi:MAG: glycoside hydrolase family 18 protein [Bacteroidota bacterium]|nr:glycoside hydrolase family 18 protein [Bacteroidota bacterium]
MKKLKQFRYPLLLVMVLFAFAGCKKDEVAQQEAANPISPRIFDNLRDFAGNRIISEGETAKFSGIQYTPAGKVKISWLVNGVQASSDTAFNFKPTGGGEFTIKLKITYNGDSSVRSTKVLVNPTTYTLKSFDKVTMAYLTSAGAAANINWGIVSHVAYKVGLVSPDGSLDVSTGEINQTADELVARSHINGIPIIMGISGRLSGIDGWAIYETNDFGTAIINPTSRAALVNSVKTYVTNKRMDGVDIMMTDINSGQTPDNMAAIAPFLAALRTALPGKIITVTVTVNYQHWGYPDLSSADWVNIHAFEDNIHIGPGAPVGQSSSYDFMVSSAQIWTNFHLPANKIVVGMPAFGLRYDELDGSGNNLSWGSYSYAAYKDILAFDPTAFGKEETNMGQGIYFNGVPLITKKATWVKNNGFKGSYLWAEDYDVLGANSLLSAIFNAQK